MYNKNIGGDVMTNEEMLAKLIEGQAVIMKKLDDIENEAKITRNAVNYSSDKLEELITLLNETNVISMKY